MEDLLKITYMSWGYLLMISLILLLILFVVNKFHLLSRYSWETSIRYHIFFIFIILLASIAFLLVRPLLHLLLLLIIFGVFFRQITAYIHRVFDFYWAGVEIGDEIEIVSKSSKDIVKGSLKRLNFGGFYLQNGSQSIYYPYHESTIHRIIRHSISGQKMVSLRYDIPNDMTNKSALQLSNRILFDFPYINPKDSRNEIIDNELHLDIAVNDRKHADGLCLLMERQGFSSID